jgi:hypothetical protein
MTSSILWLNPAEGCAFSAYQARLELFSHQLTLEFGKAMLAIKGLRIFVLRFRLEGQQDRAKFSGLGLNKLEDGLVRIGSNSMPSNSQYARINARQGSRLV